MKRLLLLALISLGASLVADAQSFFAQRRSRSLIFTAGTGTSSYYGELTNDDAYLQARPNLNLGLQYYISRRIALRSEVTWFQLHGDDKNATVESGRQPRNLSFSSNNYEINFTGILNFTPHGRRFYQRPQVNFYGFIGIGLCYFNPTTEYQGQKYTLSDYQTELVAYGKFTPVIPMGLGIRFKLGPMTNLAIEGGLRKTFTDYLDDVSTTHNAAAEFPSALAYALSDRRPELGLANAPDGYIRGNPDTDDAYMLFNVKFEYYLPVNFLEGGGNRNTYKHKRKAFYRYNKRGGLKKK